MNVDPITQDSPPLEAQEDHPGITSSGNPGGRGIHRRVVEDFDTLTPADQKKALLETWRGLAMGIAVRAKSFATTCSPKDYNKLYNLVQSGAVALDRAFPEKKELQSPRLIVNLFQSLGLKAGAIAIPDVPKVIEGKVNEVPDRSGEGTPT